MILLKHSSTAPASISEEDPLLNGSEASSPPLTGPPQPKQLRSNIVLFGEMGAGKSSLVNLIMGRDVAKVSSGALSCTLDARSHDVTIQGRDFRIYDTAGLNEPQSLRDPDCLIGAINKAYRLITWLSDTGGINLLVFCVRRGRITTTMQQHYKLFNDFLCQKKVPIALVVTHLEQEEKMENWWLHNYPRFEECGIHVTGHACITTKPQYSDRYLVSKQLVHELLITHGCGLPFTQERVSWVTELFQKLLDLVGFRPQFNSVKVRAKKLREYGLKDNEINALLARISAVDEDMAAVRRPYPYGGFARRRGTHS